jgi:hypothetical protein
LVTSSASVSSVEDRPPNAVEEAMSVKRLKQSRGPEMTYCLASAACVRGRVPWRKGISEGKCMPK